MPIAQPATLPFFGAHSDLDAPLCVSAVARKLKSLACKERGTINEIIDARAATKRTQTSVNETFSQDELRGPPCGLEPLVKGKSVISKRVDFNRQQ